MKFNKEQVLSLPLAIACGLLLTACEINLETRTETGVDASYEVDIRWTSHGPEWSAPLGLGSNGVAVGSELSASGRGILLGNPHYPWEGASRFHMIHLTIPGELDVMGASLLNTSRVGIGFNQDVAWTHTVSTALRFTLYKLELHPDDPMRYRYDDDYRDIESRSVDVVVAGEDGLETPAHKVYLSHYGPILRSGALPWADGRAYAVRDAVIDNFLTAETYDALSKATSTADIEAAISRQGIYWVNTIAADRHGNAFYADISAAPNVDAALLENCRVMPEGASQWSVVLDGSRSECEWHEDERSSVPGTLPPDEMPRTTRVDYVTNSNDSYWLSNADAPLEGYSPIIGTERSLRTRAGLSMMSELIERGGQVTPEDVQEMLYSHRNHSAELVLDDVLTACDGEQDLAFACGVLTYSQSPEPDSPFYSDQTEIYAQGGWVDLPFSEAEIIADQATEPLSLRETY